MQQSTQKHIYILYLISYIYNIQHAFSNKFLYGWKIEQTNYAKKKNNKREKYENVNLKPNICIYSLYSSYICDIDRLERGAAAYI